MEGEKISNTITYKNTKKQFHGAIKMYWTTQKSSYEGYQNTLQWKVRKAAADLCVATTHEETVA